MRVVVDNLLHVDFDGQDPEIGTIIRKDLTFVNPGYTLARRLGKNAHRMPRTFQLARGRGSQLQLPRGYRYKLWQRLKEAQIIPDNIQDFRVDGAPIAVDFHGELRTYQQQAVQRAIEVRDGVICAPTGCGKTIIALGMVAELARQSLILVHTTALLEQTAERIRTFLGVEPGIIGGGQDRPGPITVATVQTLMRRPEDYLTDQFGLLILDEAHHCPAKTFQNVLQRFPARYRIGLTATPERKDQMHPVLYATAGPLFHRVDAEALRNRGAILRLDIQETPTEFRFYYDGNHSDLLEALVNDERRNALIVSSILNTHRGRSLVLTDRVAHAFRLAEELGSEMGNEVGVVVGQTPTALREEIYADLHEGKLKVLIATSSLVGEGFDCPGLDALFLCTPTGNASRLTQLVGRILRPFPGKPRPLVVDFVDQYIPVLMRQSSRRKDVYAEHEWRPEHDEFQAKLL